MPNKPRYFTIASTPRADPRVASLMLKVETHVLAANRVWTGSFSAFAREAEAQLCLGEGPVAVRYAFQESTFSLPKSPANVLMIATGTGVAPFVGIIRDKAICLATGEDCPFRDLGLIFGCRNDKEDYILSKCLGPPKGEAALSHLVVAFSRMAVP